MTDCLIDWLRIVGNKCLSSFSFLHYLFRHFDYFLYWQFKKYCSKTFSMIEWMNEWMVWNFEIVKSCIFCGACSASLWSSSCNSLETYQLVILCHSDTEELPFMSYAQMRAAVLSRVDCWFCRPQTETNIGLSN